MKLLLIIISSIQIPAPNQDHPIALVGGTIHTITGSVIENGTVLFEQGKITAVGTQVAIPDGTERISISGKYVYPGLISANTTIGLVEILSVEGTSDFSETGDINPDVRAEFAINSDSEVIPVTRANGITMALSVPHGGLISGTSALIMLDGWTWKDMTLKAPVGLHIFWPSLSMRGRFYQPMMSPEKIKKEYYEKLEKLQGAFADARAYLRAKEAEKKKGIPYHNTDVRWEAMIPVLKGKIPVFIHADDIVQIQSAIAWASEENVQIVIVGGYDAWMVTNLLKEKNIPVIIGGTHRLPKRRWEAYDTPFTLPLKLFKAGVKFCIAGSGSPWSTPGERNLPYQAATAVAYGLPEEEALKAITLYPAQILGVTDRVGSIEVGKDATLIVTDGDLLQITTSIEMEFIQGRKIDLSNRQIYLFKKYLEKYKRMGLIKE